MTRLIVFALIAAPLFAQPGMPSPPKQLDRLAPLLGRWEGKGTFNMQAGGQAMPWTSVSHIRKVFNGHFIRDDNTVSLGPDGAVGTLGFIAHYKWDAQAGKIVSTSVGNMGQLDVAQLRWSDENTLITVSTGWEEGRRIFERWTTKFKDGKQFVKGEKAVDDGPLFVHVEGVLVKKEGSPPDLSKVGAFMNSPSEHMEKVARMNGHYDVKGSFTMMPGQEPMQWTGEEKIENLFGGMVIQLNSSGSMNYQGWGALVWDANHNCYRSFHCDTMGSAHESKQWMMESQMVANVSMMMMGQPMTFRNVITLDPKGRPMSALGHTMGASGPPFKSYEATYTPKVASSGSKGN